METGLYALKVTIMGMGATFTILILLALVMQAFAVIFNRPRTLPAGRSGPAGAKQAEAVPAAPEVDPEELVAVIAAAAHYATTRWKRSVLVKAVIPAWNSGVSPWADAGRRELISSRAQLRRAQ